MNARFRAFGTGVKVVVLFVSDGHDAARAGVGRPHDLVLVLDGIDDGGGGNIIKAQVKKLN